MMLTLLVIHMVINSEGPITEKQDLAVDTTQTDELLSDNETTYLFQFNHTKRISSSLSVDIYIETDLVKNIITTRWNGYSVFLKNSIPEVYLGPEASNMKLSVILFNGTPY